MIIVQNTSKRSENNNKITRNKTHTAKAPTGTNHENNANVNQSPQDKIFPKIDSSRGIAILGAPRFLNLNSD
jgi:hypothetical protein